MKTIAVIPGDGIGEEVVREGLKVLEAVAAVNGDLTTAGDLKTAIPVIADDHRRAIADPVALVAAEVQRGSGPVYGQNAVAVRRVAGRRVWTDGSLDRR